MKLECNNPSCSGSPGAEGSHRHRVQAKGVTLVVAAQPLLCAAVSGPWCVVLAGCVCWLTTGCSLQRSRDWWWDVTTRRDCSCPGMLLEQFTWNWQFTSKGTFGSCPCRWELVVQQPSDGITSASEWSGHTRALMWGEGNSLSWMLPLNSCCIWWRCGFVLKDVGGLLTCRQYCPKSHQDFQNSPF